MILTRDTDPFFAETLALPPPSPGGPTPDQQAATAFVADVETGMLRPASPDEFWEYALGGEYDERLGVIGD